MPDTPQIERPRFLHPDLALAYILNDQATHKELSNQFPYCEGYIKQLAAKEKWTYWREQSLTLGLLNIPDLIGLTKASIIEQHIKDGLKLQRKSSAALDGLEFERATEAASNLERGQNMVLRAIGEPDQRIEHSGGVVVEFEIIESNGNDPTKG